MQSVMISIQPVWDEKILNGIQNVIVRKSKPKLQVPFKCYIYCTNQGRPLVYGSPAPSYVEESFVRTYGMSKEKADKDFGVLNGKVVAEFTCDKINLVECDSEQHNNCLKSSCLTLSEILEYYNGQDLYGWHISNLVVYDNSKELSEFYTERVTTTDFPQLTKMKRPPQNWCYVEGMEGKNVKRKYDSART